MTIDPNLPSKLSITSSGPRPVRTPGATRATFAFLFSLLALIASGYVLFTNLDEHQDKIISPLVTAKASSPDLESRIKAQETALTVMNDAFKKQIDGLQEKLNTLPEPKTKVIDTSASTLALQGKFAEWEKQNAELQQRLRSELQEKSKNIAALALLEHITRKAHLGLSFQNDVKSLENAIPLSEHSAHAYTILRGFDKPLASDTALLDGLRSLTPDFLAREKLEKADGVFDKIGIQLQKLVVVRRKNGQVSDETPAGKSLDELQTAIISGDWPKATSIATGFAEKEQLPKDFPAWQAKLRDRALAEEAVNSLQRLVLNELQGTAIPSTGIPSKAELEKEP